MSAVTLLTAGPQNKSGTGSAVDVSAHAQLRLTVSPLGSNLGTNPQLKVWIETSRDGVTGWELGHEQLIFMASAHPDGLHAWNARRINLGNVDSFARVRWESFATQNSADGDPGLVLGVTGEGIPDAP